MKHSGWDLTGVGGNGVRTQVLTTLEYLKLPLVLVRVRLDSKVVRG